MIPRDWINSLTLEQAREELINLWQKYEDRGLAMQDTGEVVRSAMQWRIDELKAEIEKLKAE